MNGFCWMRGVRLSSGVVAAVLALTGCHRQGEPAAPVSMEGRPVPAGAARWTVDVEPYAPRVGVSGTVAAERVVHVSARMGAYVSEAPVQAGQAVRQGDLLVRLDDRDLREQLRAAESECKRAQTERDRARQLLARQATTEQALTAAESMYEGASARVEQVRVALGDARLTAAFGGVVTDRRVEVGDLVGPGQVLLSVYDPQRMRLDVAVPARLSRHLQVGDWVELELGPDAVATSGRVDRVVSEVEMQSRSQLVKVSLPDATAFLPGTFGRLWVRDEPRASIRVPTEAVTRIGQLEFVRLVRGERSITRAVRTGPGEAGRVEVLAGLSAGDVILARGESEAHEAGR